MIDPREWPPIQQYEYKIVVVSLPVDDIELTDQLNALGAEGWELIFPTTVNAGRLWFKRQSGQINQAGDFRPFEGEG